MKRLRSALFASALAAGAALSPAGPASALPLAPAAGASHVALPDSAVIPVSRSGRALTAGIIGGLIVGGIIGSHWPYRYHYYAPYRVYPAYPVYPHPYWGGSGWNAAIAYCIRRYRSYDPYSMTYLGYDGRRHRCPR